MELRKRRRILKDNFLERFLSNNKRIKIPLIILGMIGGIYVFLHYFVFKTDPIQILVLQLFDSYQYFIEGIANFYLRISNSGIKIIDHTVYYNNQSFEVIENGMLLKKWTAFFLFSVWLTPSNIKAKISFSFWLILLLLLTLPVGCAIYAFFNTFDNDLMAPYRIGQTIPLLGIISLLFLWIRQNWGVIQQHLSRFKYLMNILEEKRIAIIILIYFFFLLKTFIIGYFLFEPWVNMIFNISKAGLNVLGYNAQVVPFYLYGDNVLIFMNKSCLGFMTMLLFATMIYITGKNNKTTWLYIIFGVLFLNIINIIRFIMLYIYLEKHGKYLLSMDIHDIYTVVLYIIVFILWIFWFEKFSDSKPTYKN